LNFIIERGLHQQQISAEVEFSNSLVNIIKSKFI